LQDPPKVTQIWIFGLKTNHLATLVGTFIQRAGVDVEAAKKGVHATKVYKVLFAALTINLSIDVSTFGVLHINICFKREFIFKSFSGK
jgi:hypothetical protein